MKPPKPSVKAFLYKERFGLLLWLGFAVLAVLLFLVYRDNLQRLAIHLGWDFLFESSGYQIDQSLFLPPHEKEGSFLSALVFATVNVLTVAGVGVPLSLLFGALMGFARLSKIPLIREASRYYVMIVRSIPLLLWILLFANILLTLTPSVRNALHLGNFVFLHNRGLSLPSAGLLFFPFLAWLLCVLWLVQNPRLIAKIPSRLVAFLPLLALLLLLAPLPFLPWRLPKLEGFNFKGGLTITPEFFALTAALVCYYTAFIAEIVRSAILSVPKGICEAARSLSLRETKIRWFILLPLARRIAMPGIISQSANLIKDSSLAVIIGYPELMYITQANITETGRAFECVSLMVGIYLLLNLLLSAFAQFYESRRSWRI